MLTQFLIKFAITTNVSFFQNEDSNKNLGISDVTTFV